MAAASAFALVLIIASLPLPASLLHQRSLYIMPGQEIDDLISANMANGSGAGSAVLSGSGSGGSGGSGAVGGFNPEEAQNDELVSFCFIQLSPLAVLTS